MSIQSDIQRIQAADNTLNAKGVELGISLSTDKIDQIAIKFEENLIDRGNVTATVQEGQTYTIQKGFHGGNGTVSGVGGGGSYTLQSKTATPTKSKQTITPDEGNYGLSDVTINPIPANYQDTSSTTATASDVLATKIIVDAQGEIVPGTMVNNGGASLTINALTQTSVIISEGYHSGEGVVTLTDDLANALAAI